MEIFSQRQILLPSAFVQVDWNNVNKALHAVHTTTVSTLGLQTEADRVKCFQMSADNLHSWLRSVDTCEVLEVGKVAG
eukprot:scaffold2934_cov82-Skeletonema_marinoi.AAC.1